MRAFLIVAVMLAPGIALADPTQVPAIGTSANASASASTSAAGASNSNGAIVVPAGMPPVVHTLSPSAPLNAKEKVSAVSAAAWRNHFDRPIRGEDGVLRWTFGASLPSVVCSPLQVCDVALESNEVVDAIHLGDKTRWNVLPAVTGTGADRTTHLIVKPTDAGLVSSMTIYTDRRLYSIKLVSTQSQWTPLTAFRYPETAQKAWEEYGATFSATDNATPSPTSAVPSGGDVNLDYRITGDAPLWRPTHVYSQSGKTIILFPSALQYGTAPALIGLANDGGWFSSPSDQMLRYRVSGNRFVIDGLPEHFKLIAGVGSSQTRVDVRRGDR